ncbi:probable threonine protease PRSS50 [Ostrinia nubilalis]|uniref:probable threonine protease PRSS50 n=1 Tax=Ostrinia nubilalis TaxID=29057 RepID=UPI0030825FD8
MKVVPFVLLFVHLQDVISQDQPAKAFVQSYSKQLPKKNLQIIISRKFLNSKPLPQPKRPAPINKGYTAFPAIGSAEKKLYPVPESPYFPIDTNEQRVRVKKVLPDYVIGAVRRKRSSDLRPKVIELNLKEDDNKTEVEPTKSAPKKKKRSKSAKMKRNAKARQSPNNTRTKTKSRKLKNQMNRSRNGTKIRKKPRQLKYTKRSKRGHKNKTRSADKNITRSGDKKKSVNKRHKPTSGDGHSKKAKEVGEARRLIAARDALIEDYPYVVSIQKNREHWCAGALLNPRLVITTANCVWKSSRISRLRVRAGSRHTDHGGQTAKIQEVMKHPQWSIRKNPDYDVALLLLDRNIKFSDSVHGVDLPNRVMLPAFEDAWVTSWGAERRDGVVDKKDMSLQVFHTRLMDRGKCNNVTQRFGVTVTDNFICLSQMGRRAPCTRDTGAPAVSDGVLWGLASWGMRRL